MKTNIFLITIFVLGLVAAGLRASYNYHTPRKKPVIHETQLMDRHLLSDELINIFGDGARMIVLHNLFELGAPLGGGCDFYRMTYTKDQKLRDPFSRCPARIKDINAPMFVKTNPLREAAIRKTCQLLTGNPDLMNFALGKLKIDAKAAINLDSMEALYFAFHKAPLESAERASFEKVLASGVALNWSDLAYGICISPSWQTLS